MSKNVDLYGHYGDFETDVLARVRKKTYGEDIGQNSWTTAEEYRGWANALGLRDGSTVLEVASGSGGPALFLAQEMGCRVHGVDINVVVTGLVSNEELAQRSSIGIFVFAPSGVNEHLFEEAGFSLLEREDVTENAAVISKRWHDARAADRPALVQIEGEERFEGLQQFFQMVHRVSSERRLCRFAYLLEKKNA